MDCADERFADRLRQPDGEENKRKTAAEQRRCCGPYRIFSHDIHFRASVPFASLRFDCGQSNEASTGIIASRIDPAKLQRQTSQDGNEACLP